MMNYGDMVLKGPILAGCNQWVASGLSMKQRTKMDYIDGLSPIMNAPTWVQVTLSAVCLAIGLGGMVEATPSHLSALVG